METYSIEDIYNSLPTYQANIIRELVENNGEEKAAEIWLNSLGPKQTSHFGGALHTNANYFTRCKTEIDKLLCGHPDYKEEYAKFISNERSITIATATAIGAWLSPIIGISVVLLVPAVELIIHSILKVGLNAYCTNKNMQ